MNFRPSVLRATVLSLFIAGVPALQAQGVFDRLKQKAKDKINGTTTPANPAPAPNGANNTSNAEPTNSASPAGHANAPQGTATLTTYKNYDFVPGDKIIFEDDFTATQDGEFPEKWELLSGQGVVNQQAGYPAFVMTVGDTGKVRPRITIPKYLGNQFTLEFDAFGADSQWGPAVYFSADAKKNEPSLTFRDFKVLYQTPSDVQEGTYPEEISMDKYKGKWHHIAVAYKAPQIKVYVDQYRVLYLPDMHFQPEAITFGGVASPTSLIVFRGVRLATGGGANYVGQKFTGAKIVAHGINFDSDRATLRPESMGTLNQIKKLMDSDASLKFEIDGHTDNTGGTAHNQQLSEERANAVKTQLVLMGIEGSRLTAKGFGETKPLGPNATSEDRANNRRVEFVRM